MTMISMIMIMITILMMIRSPSDPPAPTIHLGESLDPENIAEGDHVYFECRFVVVVRNVFIIITITRPKLVPILRAA